MVAQRVCPWDFVEIFRTSGNNDHPEARELFPLEKSHPTQPNASNYPCARRVACTFFKDYSGKLFSRLKSRILQNNRAMKLSPSSDDCYRIFYYTLLLLYITFFPHLVINLKL